MEYILSFYTPNWKYQFFHTKDFSSMKTLTQYIRRNKITVYQISVNGEPITHIGNQEVSLSQLENLVAKLKKPIHQEWQDQKAAALSVEAIQPHTPASEAPGASSLQQ